MDQPSSPMSIGFLLSGPIGLAVADSAVITSAIGLGLEVFVTVGGTPGLMEDYEALILHSLSTKGICSLTESETKQKTDTLVCVGWRSMVGTERGLRNVFVIHDSLLPELRGWNPLVSAIETGLGRTGVTLFQAEAEPDTGAIVSQRAFDLDAGFSIARALEKAGECAEILLIEFLHQYAQGAITTTPQDESLASISPWRNDDDYLVDWSKPSSEIHRFVLSRGFPYQGARTSVNGALITIGSSRVVEGIPRLAIRSPGKTIAREGENPIVACGSGYVEISGLLQAGGTPFRLQHLRTRFGT